ncbi:threonylcarbamoyl-AMP synthase [Nesterenkonia sp. LB17]|uniref:L-threonylcarbamoyladenylate synthase n=1 Tax=unclassified Nesterenkonia TaxID=2629769 RepID=UPI001F4C99B8|nr:MULTISPECIES: L-threonylcarbamoyladenylate synthase [unclassified Nesterenkonia]MCH8561135.1 threonylcarbamoyl-AMP synthase [Nesterenkonia sp. DZ6]MCH8562564.1 threonylcarbamoyl-AMP synthase [Nesterenkonia sp. YGD6]MCH8565488.1 threonylcarbamoyl-AMP synthase [Nesterenkonia sp. LB17]
MARVSQTVDCTDPASRAEGISAAQDALSRGETVVLPTDTVYGIGADAFSPQAVAVLLAAKGRSRTMPPPVLIGRPEIMDALAIDVPEEARTLAQAFWPGPMTLILNAQPSLRWDLGETHGTVALRMPADELALDLLNATGPLAVSSANRTGMPAATTVTEAQQMLAESVAVYLDAGDRGSSAASTIIDATVTPPRVVRTGALPLAELQAVVASVAPEAEASDSHS